MGLVTQDRGELLLDSQLAKKTKQIRMFWLRAGRRDDTLSSMFADQARMRGGMGRGRDVGRGSQNAGP